LSSPSPGFGVPESDVKDPQPVHGQPFHDRVIGIVETLYQRVAAIAELPFVTVSVSKYLLSLALHTLTVRTEPDDAVALDTSDYTFSDEVGQNFFCPVHADIR
jgi:hypothetical protein